MFQLSYRVNHLLSLLVYLVQVNQVLLSTQSLLKDSADMLNPYQPMLANSWDKWISPMLISSKDYPQQFQLIRNQQTETLVQQLAQLLKFTITCAYSLRAQVAHTVQAVAKRFLDKLHNKLSIKFSPCRLLPNSKFWPQWFEHVKANL